MTALLPGAVRAVMVFVEDPPTVARWYAELFDVEQVRVEPADDTEFAWFEVDGLEVAFHPADEEKNARGRSTVVYWSVASVAEARGALLERGAAHLRGPLQVDEGRAICQLIDPFGNVLGLDGPP